MYYLDLYCTIIVEFNKGMVKIPTGWKMLCSAFFHWVEGNNGGRDRESQQKQAEEQGERPGREARESE